MKCEKCGKTVIGTEKWYDFSPKRDLCWGGHPLKASELPEMEETSVDDNDYIIICDISEKRSVKK